MAGTSEQSGEHGHTVLPGADEETPSRAQYFSWINNTNEGSTEAHTLTNLAFFEWLHDEYGMELDIYAWDAGNIDGKRFYGSMDSERFRRQFPNGWRPVYEAARRFGCRLGLWGGPDGFGSTPEEEQDRVDMMVGLCRDFDFALFKLDGVCGALRPEKQAAFVRMMEACRRHSPDLIVLNHRLNLGEQGLKHATTFLWTGGETYIDALLSNREAATHNRACALRRGLVDGMKRLAEDHGVCLSSCLDYWDDDLILQAFSRCLILAPEIYGNPWLLRDSEFPKLARIYNLHRRHRDILVNGMALDETRYGPSAVSRGSDTTRFLALRNLTWKPVRYRVQLDRSIGLASTGQIHVRRFHPTECLLGSHPYGSDVEVEVLPFRACLIMASHEPCSEAGIEGCEFKVVCDNPGKPLQLRLLGLPGTQADVRVVGRPGGPDVALELDGAPVEQSSTGSFHVQFPGHPTGDTWHRKVANLQPFPVPADAEALYEATCFAADSNALEVRCLDRSGPTAIPAVQAARDAFFEQEVFVGRGIRDRNVFDGNPNTAFQVRRSWRSGLSLVSGGALRVDFGAPIPLDRLVIRIASATDMQPLKPEEAVYAHVSADLMRWERIRFMTQIDMEADLSGCGPVRYLRLEDSPGRVTEIEGYREGELVDRSRWRASNLFSLYRKFRPTHAWQASFRLDTVFPNSTLCIPVFGEHGSEKAYAAIRVNGAPIGAPTRAPSYPANTWECPVPINRANATYFVPLTADMAGAVIDVLVLLGEGGGIYLKPEAWVTSYPGPHVSRKLTVSTADTVAGHS